MTSTSSQKSGNNKEINKQNVPEIRYDDFEGDWEEKYLKDACIINPKTEIPEIFNYIDLESVNSGILTDTQKINKKDAPSRAQRKLDKQDILFATVRPYQQNNYYFNLDGTYVASTGYAQIKANENSQYLYYFLHTKQFLKEVMKRCTGTSYPAINSNDLKTIKIKIPSNKEQEKIASLLSYLDQKIELMEKTLKQNIKEKTYYLQNLFPNENKIPLIRFSEFNDNWQIRKIKEVLNISGRIGFRGYTQKDFVKKGEGALTIGAKHITSNNKLKLVEPEYISWNKYYESPEIMIQKGDILLSKTGTIGKVTLINKEIGEATINPNLVLLNDFKADRKFLYYLMSTYNFKKELLRYSTTTSVPMINQENINNISIKIPSHDEQIRIVKVLTTIDRKIDLNNKKLNHLKQLKKGLLQKMFC